MTTIAKAMSPYGFAHRVLVCRNVCPFEACVSGSASDA